MTKKRRRSSSASSEAERISRRRVLVAAVLLAATAVFLSPIGYLTLFAPDVKSLLTTNPQSTAVMKERAEEAVRAGRPFRRDQKWVPLGSISPDLVKAVIVDEDASFYAHRGFDLHEIRESLGKDWREKRFARGASTITQQLVKNLYFGTKKTVRRKLFEAITAYRLERTLSKDRILELYLNVIEWGDGVYGAEAASRRYFGVGAGDLTARQAALLASSIPSPRKMDPSDPGPYLRERAEITLRRMGLTPPKPTHPSEAGGQ
jgi:monofunctional biosynthetic peptidoglycan transglycosylase